MNLDIATSLFREICIGLDLPCQLTHEAGRVYVIDVSKTVGKLSLSELRDLAQRFGRPYEEGNLVFTIR